MKAVPGPPPAPSEEAPGPGVSEEPPGPDILVRLRGVDAAYGAGEAVLRDLNLDIAAGRHLALIGPNGGGKSTLLRLLHGDIRPRQLPGGQSAGSLVWCFAGSPDSSPLAAKEHARLVSPLEQRRYVRQGWKISGEEILLSGLANTAMVYGESSEAHYRRVQELADAAGAPDLPGMNAAAMSQGRMRLALILRALMSRPRLLLLDEPFDGLDSEARRAVFRALDLAAAQGCTLVISAHRDGDVPPRIGEALLVHNGRATPAGDVRAALARGVSAALSPVAASPEASFFGACETFARAGAVADAPGASRPKPEADASFSHFARELLCGPEPLLELSHVDVFIDRRKVLHDINWVVRRGEQWLVSGGNGAGKSTLLRLLYGEEFTASGGALFWRGGPRPGLEELRAGVGHVSDRLQDRYDYDLSAEETVISGLRGTIGLYHEPDAAERALARAWLERFGLARLAGAALHSLSSGNARRVLLARALAASPPVLLLDEPCTGLDPQSRLLFLQALPALAGRGVTLIYVSHHQEDAGPLFSHELRLDGGRVSRCGRRRGQGLFPNASFDR